MMAKATFPAEWGLTPLEAAYLTALRPGKVVSAAELETLHAAPVTKASRRVQKTLAQLRRKLDPYNIEIETKWGEGWRLGQAARARLTSLLKAS
jgi:DNA-binding response OmpR family regulator